MLDCAELSADVCSHLATAQLNAITVLEGMLPLLPQATTVSRLLATVASSLTGEEAPSPLVATLLRPSDHAPASPQHRNRVAALLLQVKAAAEHASFFA